MQNALITLLEPHLADVVGAAIVGKLVVFFEPVEIFLIDAPDVADDMRKEFALRIMAEQPRLDFHTRKAVTARGETRDLFSRQARAQRQAFKTLALFKQLLEAAPVTRRDLDDFGKIVDGGFHVTHLARRDFQRMRGIVVRQLHAVAVSDRAAARCCRHDGYAIGLCQRVVVLVLHHLQIHKARQQHAKHQYRKNR